MKQAVLAGKHGKLAQELGEQLYGTNVDEAKAEPQPKTQSIFVVDRTKNDPDFLGGLITKVVGAFFTFDESVACVVRDSGRTFKDEADKREWMDFIYETSYISPFGDFNDETLHYNITEWVDGKKHERKRTPPVESKTD